MSSNTTPLKDDYQIGIITALSIERAAITAMLDVERDKPTDFVQAPRDSNNYTWGRIGLHNVVIASLSAGIYGNTMATTTAMHMLWSFQNIRFGLLVGIGGGTPNRGVRLGDVVVSQPVGSSGGVFQYDLGKAKHNEWERKDFQARPPDVLLKALSKLQTEHEFRRPRAHEHLNTAIEKHEYWGKSYGRPNIDDQLFHPSYLHHAESLPGTCSACDTNKIINRSHQSVRTDFQIHYGTIASGNSLVKDAKLRDWIASMEQDCFCIEMEAAGLMNDFPCLVIRGICDYADSHKNNAWQRYACATAAALSKELLSFVPSMDPEIPLFALRSLRVSDIEQVTDATSTRDEHHSSSSGSSPIGSMTAPKPVDITSIPANVSSRPPQTEQITMADLASRLNVKLPSDVSRFLTLDKTTVNTRSADHNDTLLHSAARIGNTEVASLLLRYDAEIEARNIYGAMPLHVAARHGPLSIVKLLIEHNANIDHAAPGGFTPLYMASNRGRLDIARLLIEHNANVNYATENGSTPLYMASNRGHLDIARLLIEHNADVDYAAENGSTPLYAAAMEGHLDIAKLLIEHKASIEGSENCAWTPLQVAVWSSHSDVEKVLLEHGANPKKKGDSGTALEIAKEKSHPEILRLLKASTQ